MKRVKLTVEVNAGNAPPVVKIAISANRTFYWGNVSFNYKVRVTDEEDQLLALEHVNISLNYLPEGNEVLLNSRA